MKRVAKLILRMEQGFGTSGTGSNYRGNKRPFNKGSQAQEEQAFTHFLAYPLWNQYTEAVNQVQQRFMQFVMDEFPMHVKDFKFQSHKCIHLTILMLYLHDEELKQKAVKAIRTVEPQLKEITKGPIKVRLTQIETFQDGVGRVYFIGLDPTYGDYAKLLQIEDCLIRSCQQHDLAPKKLGGKQMIQSTFLSKDSPTYLHTEPHATFLRLANYGKDKTLAKHIFPKIVSRFNELHLSDGFGEIEIDIVDICTRFDFNSQGQYNYLDRITI